MDQALRIKKLIIDINTAEHTDKIKDVHFVERYRLCACQLYADDASLFSVFHDTDASSRDLNHDLEKISGWTFQWKMKAQSRFHQTSSIEKKLFLSTQLFILMTHR